MRRTKIVCTVGPACDAPATLADMLRAGMNVARLNFSHGTREEHKKRIALLRQVAGQVQRNLAILLDTKGPEIRLGYLETEPVDLTEGSTVTLTTDKIKGNEQLLPVNYQGLPGDVKPGNIILLADGLVALKVVSTDKHREIECTVLNSGLISSQKGINLPGVEISLPPVTDKDIEDIIFAVREGVDFIAASFVRRAADVIEIRRILEENGGEQHIIAKIENAQGVKNLAEIIEVADGIMVARGDLGVEIQAEDVPIVQKEIVKRCNLAGKPVITATQMLESMINNPRPTRAEASDVANAILDGTDAVMLSGETAAGRYPVQAVETMDRIVQRAESAMPYEEILARRRRSSFNSVTSAISHATVTSAHDLGAAAIVTLTHSGHTARMVSRYRPQAPIIAVTPHEQVLRKLELVWGAYPLLVSPTEGTDQMLNSSIKVALDSGLIRPGDLVVITAGVPVGTRGTTNMLRVHTVGDILARGAGIGGRAVTGILRVARTAKEALSKVKDHDILVVPATDQDFVPAVKKCAALITEIGGLTSHAAIVGLEFNIPVVVGVEGATDVLKDGATVTVDGQRGLIYSGSARVL